MNPRIAKELRPLLLPWSVAALAAAGHFIALADSTFAKGAFGSFLTGLAGVAFVVGCLVLTAMPLGAELHERTLALLLSQPAERTRLWKDKLLMATVAVLALGIVHGLASGVAGQLRLAEALLYAAFMAAAICSVGYWTLATRSIVVGIACALSVPVWIASSVHIVVYYFLGIEVTLSEQATLVLLLGLTAAYCAFFLWLGRRQFAGLELKDVSVARVAQIPEAFVPRQLAELFRCRPSGAVVNLIRKEFRLQKPIFLVSAIFAVCWLVALLLVLLRPAWHSELVGVLNGLTGTQIVLMVILTGCVSLGDDKALGTSAWHLTLPISARRQWFIKLFVAAATAVGTAVVLPIVLAALTLFEAPVGLLAFHRNDDALALAIPCAVLFVLSFWSASMVANTVRAALTCMLALIGIAACVALGANVPESFFISSPRHFIGLQGGLIAYALAHLQLPPNHFAAHAGTIPYGMLSVCLAVVFAALVQSLKQFRRIQTKPAVKLKYSLVLAAITCAGSYWCADLAISIQQPSARFNSEISHALASLPQANEILEAGKPRTLTPQELEQTGRLSDTTSTWLRNTRIVATPIQSPGQRPKPRAPSRFVVSVTFPGDRLYSFDSY